MLDLGVDQKHLFKELGSYQSIPAKLKFPRINAVALAARNLSSAPPGKKHRRAIIYKSALIAISRKHIKQSKLSSNIKKTSLDIFTCLARAEGKITDIK